ncbi:MAG TPA: M56 family metallopeptidase [Verrucomicrobiae bacterium]|nr:M56 family metallopeptidase [Verrucomicrobiae bacterium]
MSTLLSHLPTLLKVSAQASVLIVLVLAVQWSCRRFLRPGWLCALWLLVLLRLVLPWGISSPLSIFNFLRVSIVNRDAGPNVTGIPIPESPRLETGGLSIPVTPPAQYFWVGWLWAAGAISLGACAAVNHFKIHRRVARRRPLIDEASLHLLEDCKELMGVNAPVLLIATDAVHSPSLFGFVRPRLLLPAGLAGTLTREELRHVFLHELAHVKRNDILVGWLMVACQIIHWFNPLVWLALHRLRGDRELACDRLVLSRAGSGANESYGLTIIKLLEGFGRTRWAPSVAGILEDKQRMRERIDMIAKFHKTGRGLTLGACVFAALALVTLTEAQGDKKAIAPPDPNSPPLVLSTTPANGSTDVDPLLTEIKVIFDRDMGGGMSWTGGGPEFPQTVEGIRARWLDDKRTCVLPVKLQAAHLYRVGINSPSYRNFRGTNGIAAVQTAILFTTKGASEMLKEKVMVPHVVEMTPVNGVKDVSPGVKELRVRFNVPMGPGFSWCGEGPHYPKFPAGKRPSWAADRKTCVLPVELKPNWEYALWLNSPSYRNFCSASGVELEPVAYTFKTSEK